MLEGPESLSSIEGDHYGPSYEAKMIFEDLSKRTPQLIPAWTGTRIHLAKFAIARGQIQTKTPKEMPDLYQNEMSSFDVGGSASRRLRFLLFSSCFALFFINLIVFSIAREGNFE